MKISTRSRYGLRLLMELTQHRDDKPVFLNEIAKNQAISEKYLSKLVIPLRGAGIIKSERGAHGGYVLARKPDAINLRQVIEALEGGFTLVDCTEDPEACARASDCAARSVWTGLEAAMKGYCEALSLADIVNREKNETFADFI
jgi:Rrf2 family protein